MNWKDQISDCTSCSFDIGSFLFFSSFIYDLSYPNITSFIYRQLDGVLSFDLCGCSSSYLCSDEPFLPICSEVASSMEEIFSQQVEHLAIPSVF